MELEIAAAAATGSTTAKTRTRTAHCVQLLLLLLLPRPAWRLLALVLGVGRCALAAINRTSRPFGSGKGCVLGGWNHARSGRGDVDTCVELEGGSSHSCVTHIIASALHTPCRPPASSAAAMKHHTS
jgi:hypothetical protein